MPPNLQSAIESHCGKKPDQGNYLAYTHVNIAVFLRDLAAWQERRGNFLAAEIEKANAVNQQLIDMTSGKEVDQKLEFSEMNFAMLKTLYLDQKAELEANIKVRHTLERTVENTFAELENERARAERWKATALLIREDIKEYANKTLSEYKAVDKDLDKWIEQIDRGES